MKVSTFLSFVSLIFMYEMCSAQFLRSINNNTSAMLSNEEDSNSDEENYVDHEEDADVQHYTQKWRKVIYPERIKTPALNDTDHHKKAAIENEDEDYQDDEGEKQYNGLVIEHKQVHSDVIKAIQALRRKFRVFEKHILKLEANISGEKNHLVNFFFEYIAEVNMFESKYRTIFLKLSQSQDERMKLANKRLRYNIRKMGEALRTNLQSLNIFVFTIDDFKIGIKKSIKSIYDFRDEVLRAGENAVGVTPKIYDLIDIFNKFAKSLKERTITCYKSLGGTYTFISKAIQSFVINGLADMEMLEKQLTQNSTKKYVREWRTANANLRGLHSVSTILSLNLKTFNFLKIMAVNCTAKHHIEKIGPVFLSELKQGFVY